MIAGNLSSGVSIGRSQSARHGSGNAVPGNYIGVASDGVTPLPNDTGVSIFSTISDRHGERQHHRRHDSRSPEHHFGQPQQRRQHGWLDHDRTATGNFVTGNYIGVASDGVTPAGNTSAGIFVNDAQGNTFSDNLIAFNQTGIALQDASVRKPDAGEPIRSNTSLGIDLGWDGVTLNDNGDTDTGANNRQNFPVLSNPSNASGTETRIDVDLSSFAPGSYTIQFFASATCDAGGYGEGDRLVGSTTLVQPGTNGVLLNELVPAGEAITATATDSNGNTSEFSACSLVDVNPTMVTNTSDSGQGSLRDAIMSSNSPAGHADHRVHYSGRRAAHHSTPQPATGDLLARHHRWLHAARRVGEHRRGGQQCRPEDRAQWSCCSWRRSADGLQRHGRWHHHSRPGDFRLRQPGHLP